MLSNLNTLIGFAAIFAILSLLVTTLTQVVRSIWRFKTMALIERLQRLFGELKDTRRFVAAMLTHPTLEGQRGAFLYNVLLSNKTSDADIQKAIQHVLERKWWKAPWSKTLDLDKQTVKDIGQTVYEQIGHIVDYPLDDSEGRHVPEWAKPLGTALDKAQENQIAALQAQSARPAPAPGLDAGPVVPTVLPPPTPVKPFRGRMWMLAAAAFPEVEGKTPPLKTYVAAFHDEADASTSDGFTWRMRVISLGISVLLTTFLGLNAVELWNQMAQASPARIEELQKLANSLPAGLATSTSRETPAAGTMGGPTIDLDQTRTNLLQEIDALRATKLSFGHGPLSGSETTATSVIGYLLAVAALTLGAPFWFELLKSAIQLKSAFSKDDKKQKPTE